MKHIILYGPGATAPHLVVEDHEADAIRAAFEKGEAFEAKHGSSITVIKENCCWAMKIEAFDDRRKPTDS